EDSVIVLSRSNEEFSRQICLSMNVAVDVTVGVGCHVVRLVGNTVEGVSMKRSQALAESGLYARIVADVREGAYLTATELAELTGVKERQVHHWVAGSHRPQGDSKERLL